MRAVDAAFATLARCDQQLKDGRLTEALMTTAAVRLPVTDSWTAGRAYLETCAQTVERLRNLEDEYWRQVATWATKAYSKFGKSARRLADVANAAIAGYNSETGRLKAELEVAAKTVQIRAAQLGGHKKR